MGILTDEQRTALFADEDTETAVWLGSPLNIYTQAECIPFRFMSSRYVMIFGHPAHELGGEEQLAENARHWSDGFISDNTSRLVKFFRADALEDEFKASEWHLDNPRYIFQFAELLRDVVA